MRPVVCKVMAPNRAANELNRHRHRHRHRHLSLRVAVSTVEMGRRDEYATNTRLKPICDCQEARAYSCLGYTPTLNVYIHLSACRHWICKYAVPAERVSSSEVEITLDRSEKAKR